MSLVVPPETLPEQRRSRLLRTMLTIALRGNSDRDTLSAQTPTHYRLCSAYRSLGTARGLNDLGGGELTYFFPASTPGGSSDFSNCPFAPLYSLTIPSSPPAATTEPSALTPIA